MNYERIEREIAEMRLNVVRRSEINPMDHICEVSADAYQRNLYVMGLLLDVTRAANGVRGTKMVAPNRSEIIGWRELQQALTALKEHCDD